jgi:hypothetical protein
MKHRVREVRAGKSELPDLEGKSFANVAAFDVAVAQATARCDIRETWKVWVEIEFTDGTTSTGDLPVGRGRNLSTHYSRMLRFSESDRIPPHYDDVVGRVEWKRDKAYWARFFDRYEV